MSADRRNAAPTTVGEDPVYPDSYYEHLAEIMGQEAADWARLPRAERERELTRHHMLYNTPDDLSLWPAELDGGVDRP
jgi:hypothetical protein